MNDKGYIKAFRKMKKWEWYKDVNTFKLFMHLLLSVENEDTVIKGIEVRKGQMYTTLPDLATGSGLTIRQTRTAIDRLKMTGELTEETTNKGRLITVEKYASYQGQANNSDRQHGRQSGRQTTGKRQTTRRANDRQNASLLLYKEDKEDKEEKNTRACARGSSPKSAFGIRGNVLLSDQEYEELREQFDNVGQLLDKVSLYLANASRDYDDHYALIYKIAVDDQWPRRAKRYKPNAQEKKGERAPDEFREKWIKGGRKNGRN